MPEWQIIDDAEVLPVLAFWSIVNIVVLFLICMQLGLLTPPFGLLLFTMKGVAPPSITMNDVFQAALPYVWFGLLVLVFVFLFPPLATCTGMVRNWLTK